VTGAHILRNHLADLPSQPPFAYFDPIADRQRQIGKGEVEFPARETPAEMLLLSGKNGEALHDYQLSLVSDPKSFNALLGAGNAAEQLGRHKLAVEFYRKLLANCAGATGATLKDLERAQAVME
jgi:tetratricopeptide (TPR) repeat protein